MFKKMSEFFRNLFSSKTAEPVEEVKNVNPIPRPAAPKKRKPPKKKKAAAKKRKPAKKKA
jgi:hypothetical protein